jgi:hypothetical protein
MLEIVLERTESDLEIELDWLLKVEELEGLPELVLGGCAEDEVPGKETTDEADDNVDGLAGGME